MSKITNILRIEAGVVFIAVFLFLLLLCRSDEKYIRKRKKLFSAFSPSTYIYILIASLAVTYIVSEVSFSGFTTAIVFVACLGLAPLLISSSLKRIHEEDVFSEVILFCQNAGMLLKQTRNVYSSLRKASEDLNGQLKDDIDGLLSALGDGKEETRLAMQILEENFPYSSIRNLNVIILHMFFETSNVDESLLTTYQDDVTRLERDVRENKEKRRSLRYSYIIITLGSLLAYWFFVKNLSLTFNEVFDNELYRVLNAAYIFATMLAFFIVDRYFNLNTTKE